MFSAPNTHLSDLAPAPWHLSPSRSPTLALRLRVQMRRGRLDELLASGADPQESPELALRATQLVRQSNRYALADSIEEVVRVAAKGEALMSARVPIRRREVIAATPSLLGLARDLRELADAKPRGVALASRLLTDGTGPLYVYGRDSALVRAVWEATAALFGQVG
jgi:hypothetical protein